MTRHAATPSDTVGTRIGTLRDEVWGRDDGICALCGEPADALEWNLDHILPESLGGPTVVDNLRVTHPRCNRRRGHPYRMTDDAIDDAIDEWTANEAERFVLEDYDARVYGEWTPMLTKMWWQWWAASWTDPGWKRRKALVPAP